MAVLVEQQQVSGSAESQAPGRKRRWHHKTATGCATCRQRRVKCGEERPGCARCIKQGRVCPGYSSPRIWIFDPQKKGPQRRTVTVGHNMPQRQLLRQPSSSPFANSDGGRSFQFYFEISEPNLSKFFGTQMNVLFDDPKDVKNAILETDLFWKVQFPRLICSLPIIQHCTMFMITCHESVMKATYTLRKDPECISKYTGALQQLRKGYENVSVDCILLASLLMAMGELAYGPSESGLSHLYNASRIIEQRQRNPSAFDGHKQKEELEGMQKNVDLMFRAFFRKLTRENFLPPPADGKDNRATSAPQLGSELPFSTLQQATGSLEEIKQAARRLLKERNSGVDPQDSAALQSLASTWMDRFEEFVAKQEGNESLRIACLVVHMHGCTTLIETQLISQESDFDSQLPVFTTIAEAAEEFLERTDGQLPDATTEHLNYGVGPVNPLFYATTKCRHFAVRRRLLRILRLLRVSEGPWTSCTAFQIASYLASMEGQQLLTLSSDQGISCEQRFRLLNADIENIPIVKATLVSNGGVRVKVEEEEERGEEVGVGEGEVRGEIPAQAAKAEDEEEVQTATFHITPCAHQRKLPTYLGTIGEVGGWEGYVRNSTCTCRELYTTRANLETDHGGLAYRDR